MTNPSHTSQNKPIEDGSESLCIDRLYAGLSPDIEGATACVILQTFIDDSETDELYIVAGYVASLDDWKSFSPEWFEVLKRPPRLGHYRTSDAIALKGQFERFDETPRDQRIAALARVIPNQPPNCFGVACWVSKSDFEIYCHPVFHPAWHDPYYLCATFLIERLCFELRGVRLQKLDFFFDQQGKVGRQFKLVYDAFLKPYSMPLFPFMGEVRHEDIAWSFFPGRPPTCRLAWVRRLRLKFQTLD